MIELRALCKSYNLGGEPVHALQDIQLTVEQGDYLSVVGPSGSGKSTLLNMIGLLDRPDSGEYVLQGTPTRELAEEARARLRRERIGFIFQSFHLIQRLSAQENVEVPLVLAGCGRRERRRLVEQVLSRVGLLDRAAHLPSQLSGGQLQRVAIARAIVMKPAIVLADEPTGNLDLHAGRDVVAVLEELNRDGITLMMITHDLALAERAQRKITLVDGRLSTEWQAK